jgi:hypothetical protein
MKDEPAEPTTTAFYNHDDVEDGFMPEDYDDDDDNDDDNNSDDDGDDIDIDFEDAGGEVGNAFQQLLFLPPTIAATLNVAGSSSNKATPIAPFMHRSEGNEPSTKRAKLEDNTSAISLPQAPFMHNPLQYSRNVANQPSSSVSTTDQDSHERLKKMLLEQLRDQYLLVVTSFTDIHVLDGALEPQTQLFQVRELGIM